MNFTVMGAQVTAIPPEISVNARAHNRWWDGDASATEGRHRRMRPFGEPETCDPGLPKVTRPAARVWTATHAGSCLLDSGLQ
jgi:hypothetical protein